MALLPELIGLIDSFLPPRRSLASLMCVAAFGRVQEDRQDGYEFATKLIIKEMRTHTSILYDCRRFGVDFGPVPTVARLKTHMRLIEEIYLVLECSDEETRLSFAPCRPVFTSRARNRWNWTSVPEFRPDNALFGFRLRLLFSNGYYSVLNSGLVGRRS